MKTVPAQKRANNGIFGRREYPLAMSRGKPWDPYPDNGKPPCVCTWSAKAHVGISRYLSLCCLDRRRDSPQLGIVSFAWNRTHIEIMAIVFEVVRQSLRWTLRLKVKFPIFQPWLLVDPFPFLAGRSPKFQRELNWVLGFGSWQISWKVMAIYLWSGSRVDSKLDVIFSLYGPLNLDRKPTH